MKKTIEWIVKFFIYGTFFVPLVVIPSSYIFPFIVPKILIFRSLAVLILAGYILLWLINKEEYKIKFTPINLVTSAFIISFALSTFAGTDIYHSFWDNHERMLGLFTILHYYAYFLVCGAVFKNWKDWRTALRLFLIAGSIVMFIGGLQTQNETLLLNQGGNRVSSTLGNSIYVSSYGLFLLFASLLLILKEKDNWWRALEIAGGILALLGIFFGGSRGVILGLLVGIGFLFFSYGLLLKNKEGKVRKSFWGAIIAIIIGFVFIFSNPDSQFLRKFPALERFARLSWTEVTKSPRFIAWEISVESWKERPILGWGPNNFFYAFNKYYNPRSLDFGYGETWFDNAHNIILNTLTVQGLFGLLIYLSIFGVSVYSLWQPLSNRKENVHLVVIGSSFLIAHLAQNVTVFENPTSYLYFMFWLAMINRLSVPKITPVEEKNIDKRQPDKQNNLADKMLGAPTFITVGLVAFLFIFVFNIQPSKANQKTLVALQTLNTNLAVGLPMVREVIAFGSPHIDDIRADLSRTIMQQLTSQLNSPANSLDKEKVKEAFDLADTMLQDNFKLHPMDIRNHLVAAQLYQVGGVIFGDVKMVVGADNYMTTALYLSPKRQQIMYGLSNIKMQLGRNQEAITLLEEAMRLNPKISESYWRLAYTYHATGDIQKAREIILLAEERGIVFDSMGESVINPILATGTTPN